MIEKEEVRQFGELTVYRERGNHLRRLEQFSKAKENFSLALNNSPDDVRCLTRRSQVCTEAMQPMQAWKDADGALKLEPDNLVAQYMKARALFAMTEYERSIIVNSRALRRRKQPPYFLEGMNTSLQAIQNCIGENCGNVMINMLPLIKKIEVQKYNTRDLQKPVHKCRIPQPEANCMLTQMEARKYSRLGRVMAMKYLGPMAYDKVFLKNLKNDRRLTSANVNGSTELKSLVNETLSSLSDYQETLRTQLPYYTIKLAEKTNSKRQYKFKQGIIERERDISILAVEKSLKLIEKCLRENRIKDLISRSERLQMFIDSKSNSILPERDYYIDRLYRMVGEAYYFQHRLSYTKSERGNRQRIAFLMGLPLGYPKSHDSVVSNYPHKYVDLKIATQKVMSALRLCDNATMKCWLLYEVASLLLSQKKYVLSKYYAKQCQRQAHNSHNVVWWMNSCFILLSSDMRQGNANDVRLQVQEALVWAKKMLKDSERVQAFLSKCAEMASDLPISDAKHVQSVRERQILSVMNEDERSQTKMLFKKISNVTPGRQMKVVPNLLNDKLYCMDRKRNLQKGLTIVSGKPKPLPPMPKTQIPGLQLF